MIDNSVPRYSVKAAKSALWTERKYQKNKIVYRQNDQKMFLGSLDASKAGTAHGLYGNLTDLKV